MNRNSIFYVDRAGNIAPSCVLCNEEVEGITTIVIAAGFTDDVERLRAAQLHSFMRTGPVRDAGMIFDDERAVIYVSEPITGFEAQALARVGFSGVYTFA